jgi:hypothetical protein
VARPWPEEVPVSFPSEPGRDDGNLPPVNVVIPDDARELDRDVLAYRREVRARRRNERLLRIVRPLGGARWGSGVAIIPLIAACLALTLVGGALLSVMTISPASAPTRTFAPPAATSTGTNQVPVPLPAGTVLAGQRTRAIQSLVSSVIAIIPEGCDCGPELKHLAALTEKKNVALYFAGSGTVIKQLAQLSASYSDGWAVTVADADGVLQAVFHPAKLLVLLVFTDARAIPLTTLPPDSKLIAQLGKLKTVSV